MPPRLADPSTPSQVCSVFPPSGGLQGQQARRPAVRLARILREDAEHSEGLHHPHRGAAQVRQGPEEERGTRSGVRPRESLSNLRRALSLDLSCIAGRGQEWHGHSSYPKAAEKMLATRSPKLALTIPATAAVAPKMSKRCSGNRGAAQIRPKLADLGRVWVKVGHIGPECGSKRRIRSICANCWPTPSKLSPNLSQHRPMIVDTCQILVKLRQHSPNWGPNRPI